MSLYLSSEPDCSTWQVLKYFVPNPRTSHMSSPHGTSDTYNRYIMLEYRILYSGKIWRGVNFDDLAVQEN